MAFPLYQSPTDYDFRFRNASGQLMAWNFLARCDTRYKQNVVDDVIIPFAQHYFIEINVKRCFYFFISTDQHIIN